ncbi:hypothetical protein COCNU_scaffold008808G000040 [Cocos nucifera]|nr:hypothetical protein [Cocos nucifera]
MVLFGLRGLRLVTVILGTLNLALAAVGALLVGQVLRRCGGREKVPAIIVAVFAIVRIMAMIGMGIAQEVTAITIANLSRDDQLLDSDIYRRERRTYCDGGHFMQLMILHGKLITGRSVLEEDEVYSVARLLGDLVAYRASGTGHLELLAGLLQTVELSIELGFISETKREAAYFVVVLHDQRSIIIAVRGTETPEDLITDGLYDSSEMSGFLSSLLGVGCECHGYKVRIVGHSLGGAVATLLGLRLYRRFPNLHVYAYGSLPCVDFALAEACSDFVTTIVYNDEFSACLCISSILRLRAAAITALSDNSSADSAMIHKLARRILHINKYHESGEHLDASSPSYKPSTMRVEERSSQPDQELHDPHQEEASLFANSDSEILKFGTSEYTNYDVIIDGPNECNYREPCFEKSDVILSFEDQISQSLEDPTSVPVSLEPPEVFLPGFIIHIVREPRSIMPLWKSWIAHDHKPVYRAFVAKRESFRDIIVTPSMFIDHLPWSNLRESGYVTKLVCWKKQGTVSLCNAKNFRSTQVSRPTYC